MTENHKRHYLNEKADIFRGFRFMMISFDLLHMKRGIYHKYPPPPPSLHVNLYPIFYAYHSKTKTSELNSMQCNQWKLKFKVSHSLFLSLYNFFTLRFCKLSAQWRRNTWRKGSRVFSFCARQFPYAIVVGKLVLYIQSQ